MKNGCNYVAPWVMDVLKDLYKCKLSFSEVGGGGADNKHGKEVCRFSSSQAHSSDNFKYNYTLSMIGSSQP